MKKIFLIPIFLCLYVPILKAQSLDKSEQESYLNEHNFYRKIIGVKDLTWSNMLTSEAQHLANLRAAKPYSADITTDYGINIYKSVSRPTAEIAVSSWAKSQKYYHGEEMNNNNIQIIGHYTQIIWNSTTKLGCALSQTQGKTYILICLYSPIGNKIGEKPK